MHGVLELRVLLAIHVFTGINGHAPVIIMTGRFWRLNWTRQDSDVVMI